jgi:hypothetical protein
MPGAPKARSAPRGGLRVRIGVVTEPNAFRMRQFWAGVVAAIRGQQSQADVSSTDQAEGSGARHDRLIKKLRGLTRSLNGDGDGEG